MTVPSLLSTEDRVKAVCDLIASADMIKIDGAQFVSGPTHGPVYILASMRGSAIPPVSTTKVWSSDSA